MTTDVLSSCQTFYLYHNTIAYVSSNVWIVLYSVMHMPCLHANDGCLHVQCRSGECYLPDCIPPTAHTCSAPDLIVWGDLSQNSPLSFVFVEGTLNCTICIQNIVQSILLSLTQLKGCVLFQQNNACTHHAHTTQQDVF